MRHDGILVNSHTGRNECSESLTEADLAYFVPNMDTILFPLKLALSRTYKEDMVDHDR